MAGRTRQRLGQHFLHDPAVIARIVALIAPRVDDRLVEIGPGAGALTKPLLEKLTELHVVELDPGLAARLAQDHPDTGLRVHRADALRFDYGSLAAGPRSLRVVGNLPYNISTPLLFHLLGFRHLILDMHLMLQREVVERMVAHPGNKSYGRLTVMLALAARAERCFDIGPGAFQPAPQVWSSFVRLVPHDADPFQAQDTELVRRLVAGAFAMRRKRISNSLKPWLSGAEIQQLGIDPGLRPEQLEPRHFVSLANAAAAKGKQGNAE